MACPKRLTHATLVTVVGFALVGTMPKACVVIAFV